MDNIDRYLCEELGFPSPPKKIEGSLLEAVWILLRRYKSENQCTGKDPACPCQDGDQCHYLGENPMLVFCNKCCAPVKFDGKKFRYDPAGAAPPAASPQPRGKEVTTEPGQLSKNASEFSAKGASVQKAETLASRPSAKNLQAEPSYPAHETVVFAMSAPDMTCHIPTNKCRIEEPHSMKDCKEFDELASPTPCCPKCGSDKLLFCMGEPHRPCIGCDGCGADWKLSKPSDIAQFFPSSPADTKELAGRIAERIIREVYGPYLLTADEETKEKASAPVRAIIEEELKRP